MERRPGFRQKTLRLRRTNKHVRPSVACDRSTPYEQYSSQSPISSSMSNTNKRISHSLTLLIFFCVQSRMPPATTTASEKTAAPSAAKAPPVISGTSATNLDPETLDMQRRLITKQKQLLELQQKKLELELLQAQVKLQEQMKSTNNSSTSKASTTAAHVS